MVIHVSDWLRLSGLFEKIEIKTRNKNAPTRHFLFLISYFFVSLRRQAKKV